MNRIFILLVAFLGFSTILPVDKALAQKKPTMTQEERLNDSWILQEYDGKPPKPRDFPSGFPSLQFSVSKDKVNGFGGCNRFHATIKVRKNKLTISNIEGTKLDCPGDNEADFLEKLKEVKEYKIEGALMELKSDDEVLMVFHRFEEKKPVH